MTGSCHARGGGGANGRAKPDLTYSSDLTKTRLHVKIQISEFLDKLEKSDASGARFPNELDWTGAERAPPSAGALTPLSCALRGRLPHAGPGHWCHQACVRAVRGSGGGQHTCVAVTPSPVGGELSWKPHVCCCIYQKRCLGQDAWLTGTDLLRDVRSGKGHFAFMV